MPGGDLSFEKKFGQLAYAQIAEKVPSLIAHYKGFQLLDKNDDDTEAAGVAAFLVNDLFMYIPVFFLSGDIKGTDLLYVYQRDMFVPSTDNWVVSLKKFGLNTMGKSVKMDNPEQSTYTEPGGITLDSMNMENIRKMASQLSDDPNTLITGEAVEAMFGKATTMMLPTLAGGLKGMGKQAASAFMHTFAGNPDFANALLAVYEPDALQKIAEEATKSITEVLEGPEPEKVTIIDSIEDEEVANLSSQEKKLLMANGTYVIDHRANPSKVYRDRVESDTLSTPQSSGIYNILMRDGSYKKLAVIRVKRAHTRMRNTDRNVGRQGGTSIILIDPEKPTTGYCVEAKKVHGQIEDANNATQLQVLDKLKEVTRMELDKRVTKINEYWAKDYEKRPTKAPTRRIALLCGKDDAVLTDLRNTYDKSPDGDGSEAGDIKLGIAVPIWGDSVVYLEDNNFIVNIAKNKYVETVGDVIMIPRTARMLDIDGDVPWELGRPETLPGLAHKAEKEGSLMSLELYVDGNTASINTSAGSTGRIGKTAALRTLVLHHGIAAQDAQHILKEARDTRSGCKRYLVEHASQYKQAANVSTGYSRYGDESFGNASSSDSKPDISFSQEDAVDQTVTTHRDRSGYGTTDGLIDDQGVDQAVAASQAGIKEVFDTTVLQQLLDVADIAELRTDYVSDLLKATDSIGRLIFLFYWHREAFEDKYGTSEVAKLENTLINVFSSVGDLTLFLREKTSEHHVFGGEPTDSAMSSDIGTASEGLQE